MRTQKFRSGPPATVPRIGARPAPSKRRIIIILLPIAALLLVGLMVGGFMYEARTSYAESLLLSRFAKDLTYSVAEGPSAAIGFPRGGPEDKRRGYSDLPGYLAALREHNFVIANQASWSPELKQFARYGGYPVYHEKRDAGLTLLDRSGQLLYRARYPERTYESFPAIPPLIVNTLRFIEDRLLLDPSEPRRNPAVNWNRLAAASFGLVAGSFDPALRRGGASTLATQTEKFRHYPEGLTRSVGDKLGQMFAASTRSYLNGPETIDAQKEIIWTYLNSTPLSARPGYGEVIGIADGLWAWYGTTTEEVDRAFGDNAPAMRKGEIYKQVLSLLLAQRRPAYYLLENRKDLDVLTDTYLQLLASAGVIDEGLRDEALRAPLKFLDQAPAPKPVSFVMRKAATSVQTELLRLLGVSSLYDLDRVDLTANTSVDAGVQEKVSGVMERLDDRNELKSLGLYGQNLLGTEDPSRIAYSVVVYERGANRNFLRVHADSVNQPFDLNSGSKLILGSTAKLRTTITYLGILARLHDQYQSTPASELRRLSTEGKDPLTRWAAGYLAQAKDRSLQTMLDAAMQRHYSASPGSFFTGGGVHVFANFERSENSQIPTVQQAFTNSINNAFVRVMRDIRDYYIAQQIDDSAGDAAAPDDQRLEYLTRFADQEGKTYLTGFYQSLHGRPVGDMLSNLAERAGKSARRLTVVFRAVEPDAPATELHDFLQTQLRGNMVSEEESEELYDDYAPGRYSLSDQGYLAHVHPLALWLAKYLRENPEATLSQVFVASQDERQSTYGWLFKTRRARAQDKRIGIIREQDAFDRILDDWRAQGYPFNHLVPSLATAIGSSGDRPDALAELMGIVLNDGVRQPTLDIEKLSFAAGTPYETELNAAPAEPKRVFAPEIARAVRRALTDVVAHGTAARLKGAYLAADGTPLLAGGKTGTGDNRYKTFGAGHQMTGSRVVDRTATFVFFLGDHFYGTVTAYVAGSDAEHSHFTSALAVQLLKGLEPQLHPLFGTPSSPANPVSQVSDVSLVPPAKPVSSASQTSIVPTPKPVRQVSEISLTPAAKPPSNTSEISIVPTPKPVRQVSEISLVTAAKPVSNASQTSIVPTPKPVRPVSGIGPANGAKYLNRTSLISVCPSLDASCAGLHVVTPLPKPQ